MAKKRAAATKVTKATKATKATAPGADKPNILIIWGDDIGWYNVSAYHLGVMGYRTPNIDRVGREGAMFTDWYGQQSCTAGRAAFLTGQSPIRTGLTRSACPVHRSGCSRRIRRSPSSSSRMATCAASSGKTTLAIATSSSRPCTGSTSSSATFTT